jgi:hypothetical protein
VKKASIIIAICAGVAFIVAVGQYVHRGYIGVIDHNESLRLLDHGFHLRAPWNKVTIYPVQCRAIHLEMMDEGPRGRLHLDAILRVSVCSDSIPRIHQTFQGAWVERLISPLVQDFIRDFGDAFGIWYGEYRRQEVADALKDHLNLRLLDSGITVYGVWLRSLEAEKQSDSFDPLETRTPGF